MLSITEGYYITNQGMANQGIDASLVDTDNRSELISINIGQKKNYGPPTLPPADYSEPQPPEKACKLYFNQEAYDYETPELAEMLRTIVNEYYKYKTIIITTEIFDTLQEAIDTLIADRTLTQVDGNTFKISKNPTPGKYTSQNRRVNYAMQSGTVNSDIISELETELTASFNIDAKTKGDSPQKQRLNRTGPRPNIDNLLIKCVKIHSQMFDGRRWPALETAFLKRGNSFRGVKGDQIKPRSLMFNYLNGVKNAWPEGEKMAVHLTNTITKDALGWRRYFDIANQQFMKYLMDWHPELFDKMIAALKDKIATLKDKTDTTISTAMSPQKILQILHLEPYAKYIIS